MRPPAEARILVREDAGVAGVASYRNFLFRISIARRGDRVPAIEVQRLAERDLKGLLERLIRLFLAIYARHFLDPADPPAIGLFDHGGIMALHGRDSQ